MKKKSDLVIWIVAIILVLTAAFIVYTKYKPQGNVQQQPTEKVTQTPSAAQSTEKTMAPDFVLKDMSEMNIKLSDYKGKIVILNFWAVWCKYCKQEMPDFNELNKTLEKENDVVILAIDSQESRDTVKEFLDSYNLSLHVLLDTDGAITQTYGISGFPTTLILDRDGSVFTYIPGATNSKTLLDIISKMK